jgi:hypothetical protein
VHKEYKTESGNVDDSDSNKKKHDTAFWYRDIMVKS